MDLRELKRMLYDELDKITKKGELSAGSLDIVDKLTHSIKSIDTIMAMQGYSNDYRSYTHRDSMGRYARDGYSRDEHLVHELREIMENTRDENARQKLRRFISEME